MPHSSYIVDRTIHRAIQAAIFGQTYRSESKSAFDLVTQISSGRCLLIGEGNLSFARSLLSFRRINPRKIIATTFERPPTLSEETIENAKFIFDRGAIVLHGVNARSLDSKFNTLKFSSIVFQFPHTGRRNPVEGKNPNYILVRDFLRSARPYLTANGVVCISAVDTQHYQGAFQFEKAAVSQNYYVPTSYPFDPKMFKGYKHSMTHEAGSALSGHKKFRTWVFKPRG